MEYRNRPYTVVQGIEPHSWKWTVELGEDSLKSGEAKSRPMAISAVVLFIDKALAKRIPIP